MTTDNPGALSGRSGEGESARERIIAAFDAIVLAREPRPPNVAALAARAGVARSTFYDHFDSAAALELEALRRPLGALADLAAGCGDRAAALAWVTHFWDYRAEVRKLLAGPRRPRVDRLFEAMVRDRVGAGAGAHADLFAAQAAAALLAVLDGWVHARFSATPAIVTDQLDASCAALRAAHRPAPS